MQSDTHFCLSAELAAARACTLCAAELPLGPRPVLRASPTSRILIIGQAPGTRVHATGIPWNDASGDRLRDWLALDRTSFYDDSRIAILPMGLCYPGRQPKGGDRPPMPVCAPTWHPRLIPLMPELRLTLLVGHHAISRYLGRGTMTAQIAAWRPHAPTRFPLPHPSWRSLIWERRNPWFAIEVLPVLREVVKEVMK